MVIPIRYEILSFAEEMEMQLRVLEESGLVTKGKTWSWMKLKLSNRRDDVDECLKKGCTPEATGIKVLEEGIVLALMRASLRNIEGTYKLPED